METLIVLSPLAVVVVVGLVLVLRSLKKMGEQDKEIYRKMGSKD